VVVAIADRQDGRGADGSIRLTLREEVISPDAAAAWGGRSIQLDLDLDCSRHRVMLGARRIYASLNLQGSVRLTRPASAWAEAPPGTVIDDVVRAICSPQPPLPTLAATSPPEEAAIAAPPSPVRTAAADPAPAAPAAPPEVPLATTAPPAALADQSVVVHNPFASPAARAQGPAAQPAARAAASAAPAPRPADFAVQIATVASADLARDRWQSLKGKLPDLVAPRTFAVEAVSANGRTVYRALLLGFASPDEAAALCKALRSQSVDCILRPMR
jgi:hypothetical protein